MLCQVTAAASAPLHLLLFLSAASLALSLHCHSERNRERRWRWWWKDTLVSRPTPAFDQHSSMNHHRNLEVSRAPCGYFFFFFFCNDATQVSIGFLKKCRTNFAIGLGSCCLTRSAQCSQLNVDLVVLMYKARSRAVCVGTCEIS